MTGVGVLRFAVVWGFTSTEMQCAIHAFRAAADLSVKNDGVAACSASLSLLRLASWVHSIASPLHANYMYH